MTTSSVPVHREDGELIGFVAQAGNGWVPCAVFGVPVGPAGSRDDAEAHLHGHGLAYLAEKWLVAEAGTWITVQVVEASPAAVTVRFADYGHPDLFGGSKRLHVPVDGRLRLA